MFLPKRIYLRPNGKLSHKPMKDKENDMSFIFSLKITVLSKYAFITYGDEDIDLPDDDVKKFIEKRLRKL